MSSLKDDQKDGQSAAKPRPTRRRQYIYRYVYRRHFDEGGWQLASRYCYLPIDVYHRHGSPDEIEEIRLTPAQAREIAVNEAEGVGYLIKLLSVHPGGPFGGTCYSVRIEPC